MNDLSPRVPAPDLLFLVEDLEALLSVDEAEYVFLAAVFLGALDSGSSVFFLDGAFFFAGAAVSTELTRRPFNVVSSSVVKNRHSPEGSLSSLIFIILVRLSFNTS